MGGAEGLVNPIQWKEKVEALPVSKASVSMKCLAGNMERARASLSECNFLWETLMKPSQSKVHSCINVMSLEKQ